MESKKKTVWSLKEKCLEISLEHERDELEIDLELEREERMVSEEQSRRDIGA